MIRITNLPALLLIALYERQQYKDETLLEQLWDFLDDRVGYLPRKLRAAGKLHPPGLGLQSSGVKLTHIAGFDNFSSGTDIGYVFEIEREVGSFYKGWDDDLLDEGDIGLPVEPHDLERTLAALPDIDQPDHSTMIDATAMSAASVADEVFESPKEAEDPEAPRSRTQSMPSHPPSPSLAFPTGPRARVRRNSSIHEPSPLARLFIRSPDRETPRRRQTMGGHRPSVSVGTFTSDIASPRRQLLSQGRKPIEPVQEAESSASASGGMGREISPKQVVDNTKPKSGKRRGVHFPSLQEDKEPTSSSRSPTRGGSPSGTHTPPRRRARADTRDLIDLGLGQSDANEIAGPRRFSDLHARRISESSQTGPNLGSPRPSSYDPPGSPPAGSILLGKASDITEGVLSSPEPVTAQLASVAAELHHDDAWKEKLDAMEERQKRMEELLMRLVGEVTR